MSHAISKNIPFVKILTINEINLIDDAWKDSPHQLADDGFPGLVSWVKDSFSHFKTSIPDNNEILPMLTQLEIDHANLGRIILQTNGIFGSLCKEYEDYLMIHQNGEIQRHELYWKNQKRHRKILSNMIVLKAMISGESGVKGKKAIYDTLSDIGAIKWEAMEVS